MNLCVILAAVQIGGPFPLLCTPYTETGAVDYPTLAKETKFVADCGVNGIIWPPADDALRLLSQDEERQGWETMADALDGRGIWFTPCCPGTNTADTLRRVKQVEEIVAKHPTLPTAMLIRMANDAKNDADHERHYATIAAATKLPVIIQTYNGSSPIPTSKLLIDLAKRYPQTYGWYKVEGSEQAVNTLMAKLVAAKPDVKTVFTGWGGRDWLYQYRRIGTRGVITQRPMYADLIAKIWKALETNDPSADELFAKFMYLRNLDNALPAPYMRGWNLYVLHRRGVFPNMLTRTSKTQKDGRWPVTDVKLGKGMQDEVDARMRYALGE